MTTQPHDDGIEVTDSAWIAGGSRKTSYISPWYVATLKHSDLDRKQEELSRDLLPTAIGALHGYTPLPPSEP